MKKLLLPTVYFLTCIISIQSQTLYSTTFVGGSGNRGTINKFIPATKTLTVVRSFENINADGANPSGGLLQAIDGKLYGMTINGGSSNAGIIFSYDPLSSIYVKLMSFDDSIGANPSAGLIQAKDGKLYGITANGGSSNAGVIFSYDPSSSTYTKLVDFDNSNGARPYGSLLEASDGKLYGTTSNGGSNLSGVIFSYDPLSSTFAKLEDFDYTDGESPRGSLIQASDGKLYGITYSGGDNEQGVIFSFDPTSAIYKKVLDLDFYINGGYPDGNSLLQTKDGKLYGMTTHGGGARRGIIFSYDLASFTFTNLKEFKGTDGTNPYGNLMQASDGKLYGLTYSGGSNNSGVIFSFDPSSSTYTKLEDYTGSNGANPYYGSAFIELKLCTPATTWYKDKDGDGYGNPTDSVKSCLAPPGYVANNSDCNDDPASGGTAVHPGAMEICGNELDDNCNGQIDEGCDSNPRVKITAPARDTNYIVPGPVILSAEASDPDGTIKSVDFYNDSTLLFSLTSAPYNIQWYPVPTGSYHVTAIATDDSGIKTTSAPVHITVLHNRPPVVSLTSPYDGGTFRASANIVLSAEAIAHGGKIVFVEFYNGTKLIRSDKTRPYVWNWNNVAEGNYTITARATDTYGRNATSVPVTVTVLQHDALPVTLYGTTFNGGNNGGGTVSKFLPATKDLTVIKSFESITSHPASGLMEAKDGKLYGLTSQGGSSNTGGIFSFDPASSTYTNLKDFDFNTGVFPAGSLVQASNGKLYGLTTAGGSNDAGVIFSYDPVSSTYTKLMDFNYDDGGYYPRGNLIQASDGKLYGITTYGGSNDAGVIFSYDPSSSIYIKLVDFVDTIGTNPSGGLIQAKDGELYGITTYGGSSNAGVIFSYDLISSIYTKLMDFDDAIGANPYGGLVQAGNGKLYGLTSNGGSNNAGVIFSYDLFSSTYKKLTDFGGGNGGNPTGSLVQASDQKLYGIADNGGSANKGTIFAFDAVSATFIKLKDFDGSNGADPAGSLVQASNGKLYGVTTNGGSKAAGVIFSYTPPSSTYAKLKDFDGTNKNGSNVSASLVQATNGKLYGITTNGGSKGDGVIFSLDTTSYNYTNLKDLDSANGAHPYGSLVQAGDGKLYGITRLGGSNNAGVIFSYDPVSSGYTKLKDFDGNGGAHPYGSLMPAKDGKLYGMTSAGGSSNRGVIFSFDPVTSGYIKLKDFDGADGASPYGNLMQARDGKLYGMTLSGGYAGFIFSYDPSSFTYAVVKKFAGSGAFPYGSLIQANDGKLYGMTSKTTFDGGDDGNLGPGIIFSYDLSTNSYLKLTAFDSPYGNLVQGTNGKLYGMTNGGGSSDKGVIFSYDPSSSIAAKLKDYTGENGANPSYGSAFIEVTSCNKGYTYYKDADGDGYGNPADSLVVCVKPAGYVANNFDCNDNPTSGATVHPGAKEKCNGIDDDCNGQIDEGCKAGLPIVNSKSPANDTSSVALKVISQNAQLLNSRISSADVKTAINDEANIKLVPNPARNILTIYVTELAQGKQTAISVIAASGVIIRWLSDKTKQLNNPIATRSDSHWITSTFQLDISPLASGVYIIKIISGNKVMYRQFVKL